MGAQLSIEEREASVFETTWVKAEGIMPSELIQTQKGKCCVAHFT